MTRVCSTTRFGARFATALLVASCCGEAAEFDRATCWDAVYLLQQYQAPDGRIEFDSIENPLKSQVQTPRKQVQIEELVNLNKEELDMNKYKMDEDRQQLQAIMQRLSKDQQTIKILSEDNTKLRKQDIHQDDILKVEDNFVNKQEETAKAIDRYSRENAWLRQKVLEDRDVQQHLAKVNQDLREKLAQLPTETQQLNDPLMVQKNFGMEERTAKMMVRYNQENSWLRQKVIEDRGIQKHLAKVNNELREKIAQMSKDAVQLGASKTELEQTRETIVQLSHLLDENQSLPNELVVKQAEEVANIERKLEQERLEHQKTKDVMGATIKNVYTIAQDANMKLAAERKARQMTKDQMSNIAKRLSEDNSQILAAVKSA